MKSNQILKDFFVKFRNVDTIKGTTEECFNALDAFVKTGKKVRNVSWTIPEKEPQRNEVLKFLEVNNTESLRLHGGSIEKIEVGNIFPQGLKHLILKDMPGIGLSQVFNNLPELKSFSVDNVEDFTKEAFAAVFGKFATYQGLEKIQLDLLPFDPSEIKDALVNVIRVHSATLREICLQKNKITNELIAEICEVLKTHNVIEKFQFQHLKEARSVNWVDLLKSIAQLSKDRKKNITVVAYVYQIEHKLPEIHKYFEEEVPYIELSLTNK